MHNKIPVSFFVLLSLMELIFEQRHLQLHDWATYIFAFACLLLAVNRTMFAPRFQEFSNLALSDKYIKIYRDSSNLRSGFTISMFTVQLISFTFFIQLFLSTVIKSFKIELVTFIQIFTFLIVFIICKYLIEKIISVAFEIEEFVDQFNHVKVSFRTFFAFILLPVNIILFYNDINYFPIYLVLAIIIGLFNLITYFITLRNYQNLIVSKIFYFILYLCTLEIAPYYFIYYWVRKN